MSKKRIILIVMMDGFGPDYLQASDMPNTKAMIAGRFYKTAKAMMPTVTDVNTTDYPMHMEPATGEMSQFHLSEFDRLLGRTLNDHPDLEVYMAADHGMNFKSRCDDLTRTMPQKGCDIFFAMSAERDPYIKHHRTFGGTAHVFLNDAGDFNRAAEIIRRLDGVDGVYDRYAAASTFDLHPDRIGDMVVTGDIDTVFGPLEHAGTEELPEGFRTHGSTHESTVPLIIHNREVNFDEWHDYAYNYNVTKPIGF